MQYNCKIKEAVFYCGLFDLNQKNIHNKKGSRSFEKGGLVYKTVKCQMKKNNELPELFGML